MIGFLLGTLAAHAASDRDTAAALLAKAVTVARSGPAKALDEFTEHPESYRAKGGEIYLFVFDATTGKLLLGRFKGTDVRTLKSTSENWGQLAYDVGVQATSGKPLEVTYHAPKPNAKVTELSTKISFVERVGDIVLGVGYYASP